MICIIIWSVGPLYRFSCSCFICIRPTKLDAANKTFMTTESERAKATESEREAKREQIQEKNSADITYAFWINEIPTHSSSLLCLHASQFCLFVYLLICFSLNILLFCVHATFFSVQFRFRLPLPLLVMRKTHERVQCLYVHMKITQRGAARKKRMCLIHR